MTDLQIEAASRAIAASKRGSSPDAPEIDAVWRSYMGQAKAAIAAFLSGTPPGADELDVIDNLRLAWEATQAQHEEAHEAQDAYISALIEVAPVLLAIARLAAKKPPA